MKTPKEQVDDMIDFTQVALAFVEAVKNPKAVEALRDSLISTVAMSEDKKKEYADAQVAITESNRIIALAEKKLNDVEVARGFAKQEAAQKQEEIDRGFAELEGKRADFKSEVDGKMAEIAQMKASVDADRGALVSGQKDIEAKKSALDVRESNVNASASRLQEREAAVVAREAALQTEEDKVSAIRKNMLAVASGANL